MSKRLDRGAAAGVVRTIAVLVCHLQPVASGYDDYFVAPSVIGFGERSIVEVSIFAQSWACGPGALVRTMALPV